MDGKKFVKPDRLTSNKKEKSVFDDSKALQNCMIKPFKIIMQIWQIKINESGKYEERLRLMMFFYC